MDYCTEVLAVDDSIPDLVDFSDRVEQSLSLTFEQSYLMRLAIEEIATNVIKYGYQNVDPGPIQVRCACDGGRLRVVIRDRGYAFDPRQSPEPDLSTDLATRHVGGLGVYLVRELADELIYHHDAATGWNELVIIK